MFQNIFKGSKQVIQLMFQIQGIINIEPKTLFKDEVYIFNCQRVFMTFLLE